VDDKDFARDVWRGVQHALRASIVSGEYPPGSRLVEQQLADRFGTSRGPVRTALQELERTGLVVSIDRRGTFVRSISEQDLDEITSLVELLWPFVMKRAITRIGPAEREWLEAFKARIPEEPDPGTMLAQSIELAREVFRMANHKRALDIFESLLIQTSAQSLFLVAAEAEPEVWRSNSPDSKTTIDALLAGDLEKALPPAYGWLRGVEDLLEHGQKPNGDKA
jgi:DNA-binding GntR family transcriptional regulator